MDGTIPRAQLPHVLKRISEMSTEYKLAVANVFHAGDGNLHPLILFDASQPGELERAESFGGKILELCVEAGGTITGEHGVGLEKINQMCTQFDAPELTRFHDVKAAFDPEHAAQSRQGRARAAPLRGMGRHARSRRPVAASGIAEVLEARQHPDRPHPRCPRRRQENPPHHSGGQQDVYGNADEGEILSARALTGIVSYQPKEPAPTAQSGTPLAEIEALLAEHNQMLAFEPPHFGPAPSNANPAPRAITPVKATLGGCVAAGLSGPRRPYAGAVRDFVLGIRMIDGTGQPLRFGGQVIKNVAGYDVSRLMVGALGTLGLITEVSLKVLPRPAAEITLQFEMNEASAIDSMNRWAGQALPLSATSWHAGLLSVRLSGAASAVRVAQARLGGEALTEATAFWLRLRDQTTPFFDKRPSTAHQGLWRLAVKSSAPPLQQGDAQWIEWGGSSALAGERPACRAPP